jgi:hypothetical protein
MVVMLLFFSSCILFESAQVVIGSREFIDEEINCLVLGACLDEDLDGVISWDDCDDLDNLMGNIDDDLDCDGINNVLDSCPNDPYNDFDHDGVCGDEDVVCNGNFVLDSQNEQLDVLKLSSCEEIEGDLLIYGSNQVSVSGVERLSKISGGLYIVENEFLKTIVFPQLVEVGTEIFIAKNKLLEDVSGFAGVETVHRIELIDNQMLSDISGFNTIHTIHLQITISEHPNLLSISGLSLLELVLNTEIRNNPQLCLSLIEDIFTDITLEELLVDGLDTDC